MRSRTVMVVLFAVLTALFSACGKKKPPQTNPGDTGPPLTPGAGPATGAPAGATGATPFLQGTKDLPARLEWNRDFGSRKGGVIVFRVTSPAPFGVTIVTDQAYRALKSGSKLNKSDVLLTVDAKPPSYEGRVNVPPGMAWFIIENQSDAAATVRLECYEGR